MLVYGHEGRGSNPGPVLLFSNLIWTHVHFKREFSLLLKRSVPSEYFHSF